MNNLLVNREYNIDGNWYAPLHKLDDFKSVIKSELLETCSSAGDWSGCFIQKIGTTSYLIPFNQENNYPRRGFTLYTGNVAYSWHGESPLDEDTYNQIVEELYSQ